MHRQFWIEQPALLFGLTALVGSSAALFWSYPWNFLFPCLWALYLASLRAFPLILLCIASSLYSFSLYRAPLQGERGVFSITSLQPYQSPFHRGLMYKGVLYMNGQKAPCTICYGKANRPLANCDYIVEGTLKQQDLYSYAFKPRHWTPIPNTWSLAEFRYQMKEKIRALFQEKMPHSASLLSALITGDVLDRSLRYEFGKIGLQHILAISGFHFAILISFCSFFLALVLPYHARLIALLIAINLYFFFVGSLPAIQRSWLTVLLYLVGKLAHRHASGLNLLGVSLLVEILLDPTIASNLGFQFSFVSCAGILLFARKLSLGFAVNFALLPLLLYHFHQFPLLSLLYNLFIPVLISASMLALLFTLLIHTLFPLISTPFFASTDWFTKQILTLTSYPPPTLDYSILTHSIPAWTIPFYLFTLLCIGIKYRRHHLTDNFPL